MIIDYILDFISSNREASATLLVGGAGLLLFSHLKKKDAGIDVKVAIYVKLLESLSDLSIKTNHLNDAAARKTTN